MPYRKPSQAALLKPRRRALEAALRARDVSGAELARMATALGAPTTRQNVYKIRNGLTHAVSPRLAAAIEKALAAEPGSLFEQDGHA